ncbi:hypothetical protein M9H77_20537 [Catharanthus roseus]|uniref:Uncharacterized protein n=1 Tax=Catharanthus roseus TaxID=4058 RepID=A0ACC0AM29_CATRO|nr:hypothetical protein M9H77_20537 [Catharanthus roseus]
MARIGKKSRGRQKIEMVKMKNESNLQVTFSKRRAGIFKKANELVTLCGAEVAFIIFSPGGKVFSYGHPDVGTIIERFLNGNSSNSVNQSDVERLVEARRRNTIQELNNELTHIEQLFDNAKQYAEVINMRWKNSPNRYMLETSVDDLSETQLRDLRLGLEDLQKQVKQRKSEVQIQVQSSTILNPYRLNFGFVGGGFTPYAEVNLKVPFPMPQAPDHALANMLSHGSVPNSSSSSGFEYAANFLRHNLMTSAAPAAGLSMFPGFDITSMFPRSTGASSSTNILPSNLATSETGTGSGSSSSMSHGTSSVSRGFDLEGYVYGNTSRASAGASTSYFASRGLDPGYDNENSAARASEAANTSSVSRGLNLDG